MPGAAQQAKRPAGDRLGTVAGPEQAAEGRGRNAGAFDVSGPSDPPAFDSGTVYTDTLKSRSVSYTSFRNVSVPFAYQRRALIAFDVIRSPPKM